MQLVPIGRTIEENGEFIDNPDCNDTLAMSVGFFHNVGFHLPWIGYYVRKDDKLVGSAAFKGQPIDNKVEIAYGTFENFRQQGIGTDICRMLVELSLKTDPTIEIMARTLPEHNFSTRILQKNGFAFYGNVFDPEDGDLWEWIYLPGVRRNLS